MSEEWVNIYYTGNLVDAELVKQALENSGIKAYLLNKKDSNYLFGNVEVYVQRENAVKAKNILNNLSFE